VSTDAEMDMLRDRWPLWAFSREGDRVVAEKDGQRLDAGSARVLHAQVYNHPFEVAAAEHSQRRHQG
jgi:hypothetical protein